MVLPSAKQVVRYRELFDRFWRLVAQRRRLLVAVLALSFASALTEGIGLSMIYPLLDSIVGTTQDQGRVWQAFREMAVWISGSSVAVGLMYFALVIFFLKAVLVSSTTAVMTLLTCRLREDWTTAIMRRYLYGSYSDLVTDRRGRILQRITGEPGRASKAIEALLNLLVKLIFACVLTATLFVLNWQLMLAMTGVILIVGLTTRSILFGRMEKLGRKLMVTKQLFTAVVAEPIFGASVVKLLGVEGSFLRRAKEALRKLTRVNVLITVFTKAPNDFTEFVIVACIAGIFGVLAYGFGISLQEAVPLIGAFAIVSSRLLTVVGTLVSKRLDIASMTPSLGLVHQLVSENWAQERLEKGDTLEKIDSDIEFRDVWFGYDPDKPVLKGLTLTIPKSRMIGIVGRSGIGKSTLGYLLARLYEADRGTILINNRDYLEYSIASLRRRIGYVEQNPTIFNGTVKENIQFGAPDATDEEIIEAAKAAGAHDFVMALPEGYDTPVSDQGATLSGGERQRIAIARAIVRRPDLYIIDEGTSSLDRASEALIQESIRTLAKNATVIVIAHRVSTLRDAHVIYEMLAGGETVVRTFEEVAA